MDQSLGTMNLGLHPEVILPAPKDRTGPVEGTHYRPSLTEPQVQQARAQAECQATYKVPQGRDLSMISKDQLPVE